MSKREWKPGDVAIVTNQAGQSGRAIRFLGSPEDGWFAERDGIGGEIADAHPLVVIDPESREQVEQLCEAMRANGWGGIDDDAPSDMQTVLRSFIAPPKPEEPTGLGAVVEDVDGVRHVRTFGGIAAQRAWLGNIRDDGGDRARRYTDIAAVRVLSEGVVQ